MSSLTVSVDIDPGQIVIESIALKFCGSRWDFVRLADGRAFWIHASGKKIPASGNREE